MRGLITDAVDLVLGRACLACDAPGAGLCHPCLEGMRGQAGTVTLPVAGLAVTSAVRYDGLGRRMILDYKEHGHRALARPLGSLLADAVAERVTPAGHDRPGRLLALVPIPRHRRAARGFDALAAVARGACRQLAADGWTSRVAPLLRADADHEPLKRLGRDERFQRIEGAFRPASGVRRRPGELVIIVDDVMTSGATIGEAARLLDSAGMPADGAATVAMATRALGDAASRDRWGPTRGPARSRRQA